MDLIAYLWEETCGLRIASRTIPYWPWPRILMNSNESWIPEYQVLVSFTEADIEETEIGLHFVG